MNFRSPVKRGILIVSPILVALLAVVACSGNSPDTTTPSSASSTTSSTACTVLSNDGTSVVVGSGLAGDPAAPEPSSGYRTGKTTTYARNFMVTSASALASKAGCDVLAKGGDAADAAIAVQAVLGLTVPEATGIGGGAFMLYYDAKNKTVQAYDGRETAPAAATENYLRYVDDSSDQTTPKPSARASGRSIGTPGVLRMLELAHTDHGKLAWKDMFTDAVSLANKGFPISSRLADAISANRASLLRDPDALAYFLNADGSAKTVGTTLTNPAYATTLQAIADGGAKAFYTGTIGQAIVDKIAVTTGADASVITPGKTTLADLAAYEAKRRTAVCSTYRSYYVCGMPPPSSGGIAVAQTLGILETFDLGTSSFAPTAYDNEGGKPSVLGVHVISEAERLAYADRDKYVADTDFVPLPGGNWNAMLSKSYLTGRAGLISLAKSMGTATAGTFNTTTALAVDKTVEHGTSQFTIVDKSGNVLTMTTTVESSLGSFHFTKGFILNNQLTDFSATPSDTNGAIANRVQPGKRPRSSMAPTLVFKKSSDNGMGDFVMATGSPGGSTIIQYVVKTLVASLDWGLDAQQGTNMIDFGASNSATTSLGGEHPNLNTANSGANDSLIVGLKALGHTVSTSAQTSGIGTIMRATVKGESVWAGSTDPRREGVVLGDTFKP
ncbi:gamma-glutamyltransferase family protein [Uliginosibacterium sediminicola]|uniref:Gamma-glutamyltransferase family protein n=1 Tax=Uliginosibacterium sediminicola TaxID=2024550 RepID=A0ABU9YY29_9RHOO